MTLTKFILGFALIPFVGFSALPAHAAETVKNSRTSHHAGYVKPGAAISLRHDYDGQTNKGELETFTVTLEHIYEDGYLTAQLLNTPKLHINSDTDLQYTRLTSSSTLTIPIQFSSVINGNYSLGIEVVYESLDGQQSRRVLSVPVTIGVLETEKSSPSQSSKASSNSVKGIIALSAQETIR